MSYYNNLGLLAAMSNLSRPGREVTVEIETSSSRPSFYGGYGGLGGLGGYGYSNYSNYCARKALKDALGYYCGDCYSTHRKRYESGKCKCHQHDEPTSAATCESCKEINALPSNYVSSNVKATPGCIQVDAQGDVNQVARSLVRALVDNCKVALFTGPRAMDHPSVVPNNTVPRGTVDLGDTAIVYGTSCPYTGDRAQAIALCNAANAHLQTTQTRLYNAGVRVRHILKSNGDTVMACKGNHPGAITKIFDGQPTVAAYCLAAFRSEAPAGTYYVKQQDLADATAVNVVLHATDPANRDTKFFVIGTALFDDRTLMDYEQRINAKLDVYGLKVYKRDLGFALHVADRFRGIGRHNLRNIHRGEAGYMHDAYPGFNLDRPTNIWCDLMNEQLRDEIRFYIADDDYLAYSRHR